MILKSICIWWDRLGIWAVLKFFERNHVYRVPPGGSFETAECGRIVGAAYARDENDRRTGMTLYWQTSYMEQWGSHQAISLKSIRLDKESREFVFDQ